MTESQTLLAEYARKGSEPAFRELVNRYFGLVYSAALRLVGGDRHLAEDVAQTVFADLARRARGLSREVMLGGWLHQRAFNVAAPMMRARRRREAREREAAQMSMLQNDAGTDLARITPILDEAITQLQTEDRMAIILRFFERRDFRAIGQALGSSEDAARMRVSRALDKLHVLLGHRGATLPAAALATALAGEALTAAPAGLAATVATSVLAGSAGGLAATLLKIGIMTKIKTGLIGAAAVGAIATSVVIHHQGQAKLREREQDLRRQSEQLAQLTADNERLSNLVARAERPALGNDQMRELLRLRGEVGALRKQLADRPKPASAPAAKPAPKPELEAEAERQARIERLGCAKHWGAALLQYADRHNGRFPTNFDQAAELLGEEAKSLTIATADQFEIVYQGSLEAVTSVGETLLLREKQAQPCADGKWAKTYCFVDGHAQLVSMPSQWSVAGKQVSYESFEAYEKDHILVPAAP